MIYWLHPEAEQDIADALDFYKNRAGTVVAARFLDEFERVAALLSDNPGLGTPATNGRKTFPLRFFPYTLVYRPLEGGIRILVVRHQRRKPGYAAGRQ